ncbi:MAG TPA: N-acetyltransferase [Leucothrix mucor]|uniref:N-acetyltransferase n=1 Tax=Leucothrix mucor TaxID=45248 RepID=A0A7V2WVK1_LEUMU|nr:N-acetyltransferase [Leucothrix mucor]
MLTNLIVKFHSQIKDIPQEQWNALVKDNHPFIKHQFLYAMEKHHCVGSKFGWIPCHMAVYQGYDEDKQLIAAMPLYQKTNSYGEFVFDNSWAQAWQQQGMQYYPKLVSATPYTPANGQRLLCPKKHQKQVYPLILNALKEITATGHFSGVHILFPTSDEQDWLETNKPLVRHDCQFHWFNQHYQDFDDFLATLTAKKRKNIRQERRKVDQQAVSFRRLNGHSATDKDWRTFAYFYKKTFDEKWGTATFNLEFFKQIAQTMPEQIILVLADQQDNCIAGALLYRSDHTLYGRHWGCREALKGLHFETCFYQGIEVAIQQGLRTFEPGAQGEHKIARGFVPVLTRSSHFMQENPFQVSLENFVNHERDAVNDYIQTCHQHSPYRKINE